MATLLVGACALLLLVAGAAALAYESRQVGRPPECNPEAFRALGRTWPGQRVVVCLGASIVHGRVSVDFVDLLRRRFAARDFVFVNAGLNGDLAYNALRRLDSVIACDPDFVVVLVGTNDVQSTLSERTARLAVNSKKLPRSSDIGWYRENLQQIVTRLKSETRAQVALASLPILGEDLSSPSNERTREFNAVIEQVAATLGAVYLPVHERQAEFLMAQNATHGRSFTGAPLLMIDAGARRYLLGQSLDDISRRNGLLLTTDLIHMNSQGAAIIATEVEAFIRAGAR